MEWMEFTCHPQGAPDVQRQPDGTVLIEWPDGPRRSSVSVVLTMDGLRELMKRAFAVSMLVPGTEPEQVT